MEEFIALMIMFWLGWFTGYWARGVKEKRPKVKWDKIPRGEQ